jgi:hypothetical protein
VAPDSPPKVVELVDRALKFNPAERWQCAEDMAAAAQAAFQELTGVAIPATERSEAGGKKGWVRAAVNTAPARATLPGEDVVIDDASISVSVVFEPDTLANSQPPTDVKK